MEPLDSFRNNIYSQNGEDGVIAEIIKRMGLEPKEGFWCVEFGAWDGVHLSNTFALVESCSAMAVYIEGDRKKYELLSQTAKKFPSITPVEALVVGSLQTSDGLPNSSFGNVEIATLDQILARTSCPKDYDLLSIDIDSNDLEVWEAHREYRPKIVVIEINSSLAPGVFQRHGRDRLGNSFSSTLEVARSKGYSAACHTGNLIFVRDDLVHFLEMEESYIKRPESLFDRSWLLANASPGQRIAEKVVRLIFGPKNELGSA